MTIHELRVGESASRSKTITETDVYLFAGITGDLNPAHVNEQTASLTPFGGRIAHGILSAGLISAVLGIRKEAGIAGFLNFYYKRQKSKSQIFLLLF